MTEQSVVLPKDGSRPGTPWWIRGTSFSAVQSGTTYDMDAVLRLREALAVAVEGWQPVTPVIEAANLTRAEGPGCDARAVDQWLAMVLGVMNEGSSAQAAPAAAAPSPVSAPSFDVGGAPTPLTPAAPARPAPAASATSTDWATRINEARFTPLRFRPGYVMTEVDDFLDVLVAATTAGESIASTVRDITFSSSRMKECYESADVDHFLADLVRDYEGVVIPRTGE